MSRYSGMVETRKIDRLSTTDELDKQRRQGLLRLREELDRTIMSANQEILRRKLPGFDRDALTRMAVRIAELRAVYLAKALEISASTGVPNAETLDALTHARQAYDELRGAYEALERVIERGYIQVSA